MAPAAMPGRASERRKEVMQAVEMEERYLRIFYGHTLLADQIRGKALDKLGIPSKFGGQIDWNKIGSEFRVRINPRPDAPAQVNPSKKFFKSRPSRPPGPLLPADLLSRIRSMHDTVIVECSRGPHATPRRSRTTSLLTPLVSSRGPSSAVRDRRTVTRVPARTPAARTPGARTPFGRTPASRPPASRPPAARTPATRTSPRLPARPARPPAATAAIPPAAELRPKRKLFRVSSGDNPETAASAPPLALTPSPAPTRAARGGATAATDDEAHSVFEPVSSPEDINKPRTKPVSLGILGTKPGRANRAAELKAKAKTKADEMMNQLLRQASAKLMPLAATSWKKALSSSTKSNSAAPSPICSPVRSAAPPSAPATPRLDTELSPTCSLVPTPERPFAPSPCHSPALSPMITPASSPLHFPSPSLLGPEEAVAVGAGVAAVPSPSDSVLVPDLAAQLPRSPPTLDVVNFMVGFPSVLPQRPSQKRKSLSLKKTVGALQHAKKRVCLSPSPATLPVVLAAANSAPASDDATPKRPSPELSWDFQSAATQPLPADVQVPTKKDEAATAVPPPSPILHAGRRRNARPALGGRCLTSPPPRAASFGASLQEDPEGLQDDDQGGASVASAKEKPGSEIRPSSPILASSQRRRPPRVPSRVMASTKEPPAHAVVQVRPRSDGSSSSAREEARRRQHAATANKDDSGLSASPGSAGLRDNSEDSDGDVIPPTQRFQASSHSSPASATLLQDKSEDSDETVIPCTQRFSSSSRAHQTSSLASPASTTLLQDKSEDSDEAVIPCTQRFSSSSRAHQTSSLASPASTTLLQDISDVIPSTQRLDTPRADQTSSLVCPDSATDVQDVSEDSDGEVIPPTQHCQASSHSSPASATLPQDKSDDSDSDVIPCTQRFSTSSRASITSASQRLKPSHSATQRLRTSSIAPPASEPQDVSEDSDGGQVIAATQRPQALRRKVVDAPSSPTNRSPIIATGERKRRHGSSYSGSSHGRSSASQVSQVSRRLFSALSKAAGPASPRQAASTAGSAVSFTSIVPAPGSDASSHVEDAGQQPETPGTRKSCSEPSSCRDSPAPASDDDQGTEDAGALEPTTPVLSKSISMASTATRISIGDLSIADLEDHHVSVRAAAERALLAERAAWKELNTSGAASSRRSSGATTPRRQAQAKVAARREQELQSDSDSEEAKLERDRARLSRRESRRNSRSSSCDKVLQTKPRRSTPPAQPPPSLRLTSYSSDEPRHSVAAQQAVGHYGPAVNRPSRLTPPPALRMDPNAQTSTESDKAAEPESGAADAATASTARSARPGASPRRRPQPASVAGRRGAEGSTATGATLGSSSGRSAAMTQHAKERASLPSASPTPSSASGSGATGAVKLAEFHRPPTPLPRQQNEDTDCSDNTRTQGSSLATMSTITTFSKSESSALIEPQPAPQQQTSIMGRVQRAARCSIGIDSWPLVRHISQAVGGTSKRPGAVGTPTKSGAGCAPRPGAVGTPTRSGAGGALRPGAVGNPARPGAVNTPPKSGSGGTSRRPGTGGTPRRQGAVGTPTRPAAVGTPIRPGAVGTPRRAGAGGTPGRAGADGTTRRAGAGGTPRRSGAVGTPIRPGAVGTPRRAGAGGTPGRAGAGGTPRRAGAGGTPGRAGAGGTPRRAGAGGTPRRAGAGGTPRRSVAVSAASPQARGETPTQEVLSTQRSTPTPGSRRGHGRASAPSEKLLTERLDSNEYDLSDLSLSDLSFDGLVADDVQEDAVQEDAPREGVEEEDETPDFLTGRATPAPIPDAPRRPPTTRRRSVDADAQRAPSMATPHRPAPAQVNKRKISYGGLTSPPPQRSPWRKRSREAAEPSTPSQSTTATGGAASQSHASTASSRRSRVSVGIEELTVPTRRSDRSPFALPLEKQETTEDEGFLASYFSSPSE